MEVLYSHCAGIDVHKKQVTVCVRVATGSKVRREVREFGTTTGALMALLDWLMSEQATHVVLESTGPFWRPVWHVLEGSVELVLANAREVRNVPGRKSDVSDAEWLADLLAHGLIRSSFVPPEPIRELRDLTRTRKQLIRERNRHVQRIQKVLEYANVKLASVISDVLGASGRRMLAAIIEGECDPDRLASLGDYRLKASREELREALRGYVTEHHRYMLKLHLHQVTTLDGSIEDLEQRIRRCLEPFRDELERIDSVPGIDLTTAAIVIAEIGIDMGQFPTDENLISWAGLCSRLDKSAGKYRSKRLRQGGQWLKDSLIQAAWAAIKDRDSYFHAKFQRIQRRRGSKKAIVAVAASMLRAIYHMLANAETFSDLGSQYLNRLDRDKQARRLLHRLQDLGFDVEVRPQAA